MALNPSARSTAKVPTSDTGMVRVGIRVARQSCKNRKVTPTTRRNVMKRVIAISWMADLTYLVVS